VMFLTDRPTAR